MTERWVAVPGYEGRYDVSTLGRVRSLLVKGRRRHAPLVIKDHLAGPGYRVVFLFDGKKYKAHYVHRVVLRAFVGPWPDGFQGAHLNGVRDHNALENLAWASVSENHSHRILHGTDSRGSKSPTAKMTEADVIECRLVCVKGSRDLGTSALARRYGISQPEMSDIINGKRWAHSGLISAIGGL